MKIILLVVQILYVIHIGILLFIFASKVDDLQEENKYLDNELIELKKINADLIEIRNARSKCMCEDNEQLTKAKEIIKTYIQFSLQEPEKRNMTEEIELFKKAEAFISNRGGKT